MDKRIDIIQVFVKIKIQREFTRRWKSEKYLKRPKGGGIWEI